VVFDSISQDKEAMEFYLNYAINDLWKKTFDDENNTIRYLEENGKVGNKFNDTIVETFLKDYHGTRNLKIPTEYSFNDPRTGKLVEPFLMQRYVAYKLKQLSNFGNFSGTGAGKTLSAILASQIIGSKLILIVCPNDVVGHWKKNIHEIFPRARVITGKDVFLSRYNNDEFQFLVLNYDKLNQTGSRNDIIKLVKQKLDLVILDEIHFSKITSSKHIGIRRQNLDGLMSAARKKNKDIKVLGMSATPVVNNLTEGKSLLELITGKVYDDVSTKPTIPNAVTLFEKLTMVAIRQIPRYKEPDKQYVEVSIDVPSHKDLLVLHKKPMAIEQVLTDARIPEIIKRIDGQTVIYTEYLGSSFKNEPNILEKLKKAVSDAGFTFGLYVGEDHSGLDKFLKRQIQVLIASRPISTGVDGLQTVCSNLIFNTLPWTYALYQQIIGRIVRTGQGASVVKIHHIIASIGGYPYDQTKLDRLKYKRTLSECAVEGLLPEKNLVTPQQATKEALSWLERLERGEISCVTRRELDIVLTPVQIKKRLRTFGDFSKLNRRINTEKSRTTHKRMLKNSAVWHEYHRQYREARKDWKVIPYEIWIEKIKKMAPNTLIGDFGCGEAMIRNAIGSRVQSFDHVAIDPNVESCDMHSVPVKNGTLNVAVFSLSLMGKDWEGYIKEAARCLSTGGYLFISETTNSLSERLKKLEEVIEKNGFKIYLNEEKDSFTFIEARKL
jgi:superfamily II DNA or RNA helicase